VARVPAQNRTTCWLTVEQPAEAEVVELTRRLVAAVTPNPPGDERAAAAVVSDYLDGVEGVARQVLSGDERRPNVIFSAGTGTTSLALSAHLDTHPVTPGWSWDPFEAARDGNRIYGLGTTDNKGAVAAMAVAFRTLVDEGFPGRLLLIANADEETGGEFGIAVVRDLLEPVPDGVVVAEPSGIWDSYERLWTGARGTSRFTLRASGVETHSSLADSAGVTNAIETLEEALARLRSGLQVAGRLIPVAIEGGGRWGAIPHAGSLALELRVFPGPDQAQVEGELTELLTDLPVALEFADGSLRWMAPSSIRSDDPLVAAARSAWHSIFGADPAIGCFPGGTDARLFTERGIPTLSGVGPGALSRAHHPDEYVTVDELVTAVRLYTSIARNYLEAS
jgi:succinyl-diaminopimelate desuccinylase